MPAHDSWIFFLGGRTSKVVEKTFTRSMNLNDFFGFIEAGGWMSCFRWHNTFLFLVHLGQSLWGDYSSRLHMVKLSIIPCFCTWLLRGEPAVFFLWAWSHHGQIQVGSLMWLNLCLSR